MKSLSDPQILVTICARKGSKGFPNKNIRPLCGTPLIAHSINQAKSWGKASQIIVSTDSEEIAALAKTAGATVPFLRPAELATDTAPKLPVITHALREAEKYFNKQFSVVLDLDATAPIRRHEDLQNGLKHFVTTGKKVVLSVTKARKNPYFNMLERDAQGKVGLSKPLPANTTRRQDAPQVWDANASIYFLDREFLLSNPKSILETDLEIFEMPPETAFDIDDERDFIIVEALIKKLGM